MDNDEKALNRTGYIHIAFSLGSKNAVDELTERMKNDGYTVISLMLVRPFTDFIRNHWQSSQ